MGAIIQFQVPVFACSSVFLLTTEHPKPEPTEMLEHLGIPGTGRKHCTLLQMCSIAPENLLARPQ